MGKIIAFEGKDLCGKGTHIDKTYQSLIELGYAVNTRKIPLTSGLTDVCYTLNNQHVDEHREAIFLGFMSATCLGNHILAEDRNNYDFTLWDRSFWTSLAEINAYTGRKFNDLIELLIQCGSLTSPDHVIYLTTTIETRQLRAQTREIVNENDTFNITDIDFDKRLEDEFFALSQANSNWSLVDSNRSIAEIFDDIFPIVRRVGEI